ncbi:MAG TPA: MBL fold metallo-hydrolase [Thermoanaerobaculia bacterium]|jgi:glyoxylase-like metal-dependent hydrolase (beta-lactamase superfamily II)|nr:MBL fold metallo-hydrolase [Thermoanaerobaculia bacterium]
MRKTALLFMALLATAAFAQQQDFSKVEVKATRVSGNVYMLTGAGGNIGVSVGDDGIVIVDDQFAPLAPKIREALKGITDKPIRFILNTHYHGDHTGGNEVFGKEGTIIAQTNVRKRLASGSKVAGRETPPASKVALPVITFDESLSVHVNGEEIRAIHYPHGHTDGDAVIYFTKSNVVHMGDDYFNGMFPFVDTDNGGSVKGLIANVDKVLATMPDGARVIPGHGPLGDKASLEGYRDVLKGTWAIVADSVKNGLTLQQMKEQKVLAAWEHFATDFVPLDKWTETVYNEVSKEVKPAP